ncbi:hypothetical protein [Bergeyella zoohelcum]|uniref:Uncharacterized protein n=1 Tax=Bergeyella zoohelcum TaxID=1015 RepID=A0A376BYM6_9FLAO|nr:hypothetical protein [Bergeyella zoohelcum]EKB61233.1 hypothetical protein HMPREF9700_00728 [Bergeyella zoohelcum CCUG 30536]SSZ46675.1 Uncharacterised protein [Bergeyella zoohelcum]VDH03230.1 Uncharacterised protein [Bergeyella zoohelcum]
MLLKDLLKIVFFIIAFQQMMHFVVQVPIFLFQSVNAKEIDEELIWMDIIIKMIFIVLLFFSGYRWVDFFSKNEKNFFEEKKSSGHLMAAALYISMYMIILTNILGLKDIFHFSILGIHAYIPLIKIILSISILAVVQRKKIR